MVPPMLIQPFVKNEISHMIDLHAKNGKINIELALNHQILSVNITDSGKKMAGKNSDSTFLTFPNHQQGTPAIARQRI